MSFIKIENLTKAFDNKTILNSINLTIEEGEFFSLLGYSGCGKTTTLKLISGIYSVDSGDIKINDNSIINTPMEKRNLPFVLQEPYLFPHMKVYDNLAFPIKIAKEPKSVIDEKVNHILEVLELKGLENMYPRKLSGGQKQRVSLGRGLITSPKILLLDEPFSSLDITLRASMRTLIKKLHKDLNLTVIFVTHDKEEALTLSDKIALMSGGKILQVGTPNEVYESPNSVDVASFFGNCNILEGSVIGKTFKSKIGEFENLTFQNSDIDTIPSCKIAVKSEDLVLHKEDNSILYIKDKHYVGDSYIYEVDSIDNCNYLKSISNKNQDLCIGDRVSVSLNNKTKYKVLS